MSAAGEIVETTEAPQERAVSLRAWIPPRGGLMIPFEPGKSGNPSGRSKRFFEVQQAARDKSIQAIEKLGLLMNCGDERVELMAASAILDRAFGKPKEQKADDTGASRPDLSALCPGELQALRVLMGKLTRTEPEPSAPEPPTAG